MATYWRDSLGRIHKAFNPDQPRDDHGRWSGGGGEPKIPGATGAAREAEAAAGIKNGAANVAEYMADLHGRYAAEHSQYTSVTTGREKMQDAKAAELHSQASDHFSRASDHYSAGRIAQARSEYNQGHALATRALAISDKLGVSLD